MMPVYVQPAFNVTCNIWRNGHLTSAAPDLTPLGNLSPGRLIGSDLASDGTGPNAEGVMWLRLPSGTDVRDGADVVGQDTCEVPAGSGKYYLVAWVDDIGSGFPNQHRFAALVKRKPWGVPFGSGASVSGGNTVPLLYTPFTANSAGAATPSIVVNLKNPSPGFVYLAVSVLNLNPTLNVNGIPWQRVQYQTITLGGIVGRLCAGPLFAPTSNAQIILSLQGAGTVAWMVVGITAPFPFPYADYYTSGTAMLAPPGGGPPANNRPTSAKSVMMSYYTETEPGGVAVAAPWYDVADVINMPFMGLNWTMRLLEQDNPVSAFAAPAITPFGGWIGAAYNYCMFG